MGYLVGACGPHHCVEHPIQISPRGMVAARRREEVRVRGDGHEPLTFDCCHCTLKVLSIVTTPRLR